MKSWKPLCVGFTLLLLFSTISNARAQGVYDPNWDPLEDLQDAFEDLQDWLTPQQDLIEWLGREWGKFVGSAEDLVGWIWDQIMRYLINPLVEGWKGAVHTVVAIFRAPLDSFADWLSVDVPRWFVRTFGAVSPIFLTILAVVVVAAIYIAVKLVITLL